jgi:outer membrane receptor protein involved in Fe transport
MVIASIRSKLNFGVDVYNALNANPITAYNQTYGATWLAPQAILPPRFAKVSAQFDF